MEIYIKAEQKINIRNRKSHICLENVLTDYEIKLQEWHPHFFVLELINATGYI